eukprot:1138033-Pelagomonas_calceolata.AAC.1
MSVHNMHLHAPGHGDSCRGVHPAGGNLVNMHLEDCPPNVCGFSPNTGLHSAHPTGWPLSFFSSTSMLHPYRTLLAVVRVTSMSFPFPLPPPRQPPLHGIYQRNQGDEGLT